MVFGSERLTGALLALPKRPGEVELTAVLGISMDAVIVASDITW